MQFFGCNEGIAYIESNLVGYFRSPTKSAEGQDQELGICPPAQYERPILKFYGLKSSILERYSDG